MKILHLAPQNYTGVLTLFVRGHRALGHESRLVTFFEARNVYEEDICLDLPFVGPMEWLWKLKRLVRSGSMRVPFTGTSERIVWKPSLLERPLFALRDRIWSPRIERAAREHGLWDFDIYHLEGGMSFFRDGRDVRRLKSEGRKIVSYYHGLDLRMRGAIRPVWEATDLHLTCEFDLYQRYPEIDYLFLPFDPDSMPEARPSGERIRICHAPRLPEVKGTAAIIEAVEDLSRELPVELVLIRDMTHSETLEIKASCHLAIDQIADGDMGYGVNSLETLSMGICTVTNLSPAYREFIPDHPFALAEPGSLRRVLRELVLDRELRERHARSGPAWIASRHHWLSVARRLHEAYAGKGWLG
ncbi:glycosyltransferase [Candidatus Fermentibacterales bacterium]|nr:glycosyltransferase [Candidatus Fermentibacterales bacterium]